MQTSRGQPVGVALPSSETPAGNQPQNEAADSALVLVVDDSSAQRMMLFTSLRRSGYRVLQADCGESALEICKENQVDVIVSDWMMPGMSGPELCQAVRELDQERYGYFILLTSKNERAEIAQGLENGADDFLTKPVNGAELRARINAGARIVEMQRELSEKNHQIEGTLAELQTLYDLIDSDLMEARKLQQSLVTERFHDLDSAQVSLMMRSSGHVGGDLVGFFEISKAKIGIYSLDVSGHGIASALMTARLAGYLSTGSPQHNIALKHLPDGTYDALPTHQVVEHFNELMSSVIHTTLYFTIGLAVVDLETGRIQMTQAGHPHPVILRKDGSTELPGSGGLPVGLIEGAAYESFEFSLEPGDRLLLCSDGFNECPDPDGTLLDDEGLCRLMVENASVTGPAFLEALVWRLEEFHQGGDFPDDVSGVLLEIKPLADAKPT